MVLLAPGRRKSFSMILRKYLVLFLKNCDVISHCFGGDVCCAWWPRGKRLAPRGVSAGSSWVELPIIARFLPCTFWSPGVPVNAILAGSELYPVVTYANGSTQKPRA